MLLWVACVYMVTDVYAIFALTSGTYAYEITQTKKRAREQARNPFNAVSNN